MSRGFGDVCEREVLWWGGAFDLGIGAVVAYVFVYLGLGGDFAYAVAFGLGSAFACAFAFGMFCCSG